MLNNNKTKKAFTLIEILSVISIIAVLAAILMPVIARVKHSAKVAASMSNLKQAYLAMQIYSLDYEPNANAGNASDMGLPDIFGILSQGRAVFKDSKEIWQSPCGQHPEAPFGFTNLAYLPDNDGFWAKYTGKYEADAVWLIDWNCQAHGEPLDADFFLKFGIAIRGNGSIVAKRHYGTIADYEGWWHNQ